MVKLIVTEDVNVSCGVKCCKRLKGVMVGIDRTEDSM